MVPNICHIYGPFFLNNYGLCIFIGILLFTFFAQRNWLRRRFISKDDFIMLISWGTLVGIAGGRALFVITHLRIMHSLWDVISIWEGGLSLLGSVIGISLFIPLFLRSKNIPILPILDLAGIYAPLLIGFSRFGCFFAGCCYGRATDLPWAITYTHPDSMAPLHCALHPTQVYSALTLISIFFILRFICQPWLTKPGQLFGLFLIAIGTERALMEFVRNDLEYLYGYITIPQSIGFMIIIIGIIFFVYSTRSKAKRYNYESI
ncbi:MAG TPA: prolipoprotein diacylglyceryl transferase [Candidatus Babeliales bacterium]|nr:prolipoprotein diacylglyceryl transferase [Candidatus Babeliales bacterium]